MAVYFFGSFRFDDERLTLAKDGVEIPLRLKAGQMLRYFLQNPNQLIAKETLLQEIWGEVNVSNAVVPQTISELRRILVKKSDPIPHIVNVKGKGYRWVIEPTLEEQQPTPEVQNTHVEPPAAKSTGQWRFGAVAIFLLIAVFAIVLLQHMSAKKSEMPAGKVHVLLANSVKQDDGLPDWQSFSLLELTKTLLFDQNVDILNGEELAHMVARPSSAEIGNQEPAEVATWSQGFDQATSATHILEQTNADIFAFAEVLNTPEETGPTGTGDQAGAAENSLSESRNILVRLRGFDPRGEIAFQEFRADSLMEGANILALRLADLMSTRIDAERATAALTKNAEAANALAHGMYFLKKNQFDQSQAAFKTALALDPHFHYAKAMLARAMLNSGKLDEAERLSNQVLAQDKLAPIVQISAKRVLALSAGNRGDFEKRVLLYRDILDGLKNQNLPLIKADSLNEMGISLVRTRDYQGAREALEESARLHKAQGNSIGLGLVYSNMGTAAIMEKRYTEALSYFESAQSIHELWGKEYYALLCQFNKALALKELGNITEAEKLQKAILARVDPETNPGMYFKSLNNLGISRYEQGDMASARTYLTRSIKEAAAMGDKETTAHAMFNLALVYYETGEYEAALENLELPLARLSHMHAVLTFAGQVHHANGLIGKSVALLEEAKQKAGAAWSDDAEAMLQEYREAETGQAANQ